MEMLFEWINQFGFPIVIAVYLIVTSERQQKRINEEQKEDKERMDKLITLLAGDPLENKEGLLQKIDKLIQHLKKKQ